MASIRCVASGAAMFALAYTSVRAEPFAIDQNAWLNYLVIVNTTNTPSNLALKQHGTINAISSVQLSGTEDAEIQTHQRGRRNASVVHQSGWSTISVGVQEGPGDFEGRTDLPMKLTRTQTDEGYLTYFTTGGFSLVTLTDQNHTWFSRFGRAR